MHKYHDSLRDLILDCDLDKVGNIFALHEKDPKNHGRYKIAAVEFIENLLLIPKNSAEESWPLCIKKEIDTFNPKQDFLGVSIYNENYEPADCPCEENELKHNEFWGVTGEKLENHIDSPVYYINDDVLDQLSTKEMFLAELIWELAFYGFTPEEIKKFWDGIRDQSEDID